MLPKSKWKDAIVTKAQSLGFSYVGVSKAEFLEDEAPRLEKWLNQEMHGKMGYMANHFDKRLDPTLLVPGAKSVISLLYNYHAPKQQESCAPKLSTYAYGEDYHFVLKRKLKEIASYITENIGDFNGRVFVDSAPVLERAWAKRSGLGWVGKNGNLINKQSGSFYFLAEVICDLELEPDGPVKDYCGSCTACIDACPTNALENGVVNGSKCISYLTIELKKDEQIPSQFKGQFEDWMFGCDICQDVCPWNRFAKPHNTPEFQPNQAMLEMTKSDWKELTHEVFQDLFRKSPVKRTKFEGLQRNIKFVTND